MREEVECTGREAFVDVATSRHPASWGAAATAKEHVRWEVSATVTKLPSSRRMMRRQAAFFI